MSYIEQSLTCVKAILEIQFEQLQNDYFDESSPFIRKSLKSLAEIEMSKSQDIVNRISTSLHNYGEIVIGQGLFKWRKPQTIFIAAFLRGLVSVVFCYKMGLVRYEHNKSKIFLRNNIKAPITILYFEGERRAGKTEAACACAAMTLYYMDGTGVNFFWEKMISVGLRSAKMNIDKIKTTLTKLQAYHEKGQTNSNGSIIETDIRLNYYVDDKLIAEEMLDKRIRPTSLEITITDKNNPLNKRIIIATASGKVRFFFLLLLMDFVKKTHTFYSSAQIISNFTLMLNVDI